MKKLIYCLVCLALCATSAVYGKNVITKKRYGSRTIYIRQIRPGGDIDGIPLKGQELEKAAIRFFEMMDKVPLKLISASGIRQVGFYKNLQLKKVPASGVASGNIMYLVDHFSEHTFFHELFHIFDRYSRSTRWCKTNHKDFVYTGSDFYSKNSSGRKAKKKRKNLEEKRFDDDFISRYAMSNEKEDRAETFAAMAAPPRRPTNMRNQYVAVTVAAIASAPLSAVRPPFCSHFCNTLGIPTSTPT